jgi:predicted nucleic acid-binding protein
VKPRKLLDSYALLAYLNQEAAFEKVRHALAEAQESTDFLLMNEINIGETYYILFRKRGSDQAEYFLETILAGLPIARIGNDFQLVMEAARIKGEHALSYADCFAVATAHRERAILMTGDQDFRKVQNLVQIEWLTE